MTSPSEPRRRVFRRWSAAELDQLQRLAGEMPMTMATNRFNEWAAAQGLPPRSSHAVLHRCRLLGISTEITGEYLPLQIVARMLDVSPERITRWLRDKWLSSHLHCYRLIKRSDLRRMAKTHPEAFAGVAPDRLFFVLEDSDLAQAIANAYPRVHGRPHRVRCVDTGKVYKSMREAAAANYCHESAIRRALRDGKPVFGKRWEYVK